MKFGSRSTFVLLVTSCLLVCGSAGESAAQGPLLKKLRDLNGGRPLLPFVPAPKPVKPPASTKSPTPAKKPTPASGKSATSKTPTPAKKQPTTVKKPTLAKDPAKSSKTQPRSSLAGQPRKADQSLAAKGFGMWVQESRERFYVSQVDPRGNAADAGLQRGDMILEIGGAPLKVLDEYASIAKAMRGGDRVEFEVARRGRKPQKLALQYGKAPPIKQPTVDDKEEDLRLPVASKPTVRQPPRYEPDATSGLRSVYEGSGTPSSVFEPTPASRYDTRSDDLLEIELPSLE